MVLSNRRAWYRIAAERRGPAAALAAVEDELVATARASFGGRADAAVAVILSGTAGPDRTRALRSVLAQRFDDYVVLAVDAEHEVCATMLRDGAHHEDRVRHIVAPAVPGVPALRRNVALRSSASRWVAFLDEGAVWTPDHLQRAVDVLLSGSEVVVTRVALGSTDGVPVQLHRPLVRSAALRRGELPDLSAVVVRRTAGLRFDLTDVPARAADAERRVCRRLASRLHVAHIDAVTVCRRAADDRSAG